MTLRWDVRPVENPGTLTVIVAASATAPTILNEEQAMGVAPSPADGTRGSTAYVFSDRVIAFARTGHLHLASVLGCTLLMRSVISCCLSAHTRATAS